MLPVGSRGSSARPPYAGRGPQPVRDGGDGQRAPPGPERRPGLRIPGAGHDWTSHNRASHWTGNRATDSHSHPTDTHGHGRGGVRTSHQDDPESSDQGESFHRTSPFRKRLAVTVRAGLDSVLPSSVPFHLLLPGLPANPAQPQPESRKTAGCHPAPDSSNWERVPGRPGDPRREQEGSSGTDARSAGTAPRDQRGDRERLTKHQGVRRAGWKGLAAGPFPGGLGHHPAKHPEMVQDPIPPTAADDVQAGRVI